MAMSHDDIVKSFKSMSEDDQSALMVALVSNMTVMATVNTVKKMEDEFGVSAAAPIAFAGAMPAGGDAAPAAAAQTEFKVVMTNFGDNKVGVIKVVREATSLGLKEAKDLVEKTPATIKEGLNKDAADQLLKQLSEVGATAEIQ